MIKEYFMFSQILNSYASISSEDNYQKESGWLSMLYSSFFNFNNGYIWVQEDTKDSNIITLSMHFPGDKEDEYKKYPILTMSKKNYEYIGTRFYEVNKKKPKYFILSYDDNGWIDLEIKNELLQQELQYIDQNRAAKLNQKITDFQ